MRYLGYGQGVERMKFQDNLSYLQDEGYDTLASAICELNSYCKNNPKHRNTITGMVNLMVKNIKKVEYYEGLSQDLINATIELALIASKERY